MQKNVASQKWIVFAFDRTDNTAKTGDAANITANLRLDGGVANGVDDTNPTELEDGYYVFDITQAETNADLILISPQSSTSNIQVIGVPGAVYTTPAAFPTLTKGAIIDEFETQSQADPTGFHVNIKEVNGTAQTANDNGADINDILSDTAEIGTAGAGLTDLGGMATGMKAEIESEVNDALVALKLDHLIAVADADDPVNDSIIAKMAASDGDWSGFDKATEALEALRDRGDAAWVTGAGGSDRLLMMDTTIATLASQTSFTLTAGSADNDAYNNCTIVIEDSAAATQKAMGIISAYTGATKTITLKYDPAIFTMAVGDKIYILAENALKATLANRQLNVAADGDIAGNVDGSVASVVADVGVTQAGADKVRASVCVTGDPANSIGKVLYEVYTNRLTSARAGYFENINNANLATIADISTLTATEIAYLNASISSRSSHTAANVWAVGTRALTDKAGFSLAAAGITAIWEKNISAFSGAGYAGTYVKTLYDDWINAGRLDAILDTIAADVINIDGDAMRGTDGANTTTPPTVNAIADQVWDEILTAATHNIATSAGRRLRETAAYAISHGTAQAGTATTITLAADADGGNGIYNRNLIVIVNGTGAGQTRTIADYNNTTKVCIIDREWRINPDATSEYQILADDTPLVVDQGVAQAGTATTITLRGYASSINDTYLCNIIAIIGGTGRGQARLVGDYNGSTKVVTLCGDNWVSIPDNTSVYVMIPYGTTCASCMGTTALAQINTECDTALTDFGKTGYALSAAGVDAILDEVVEGTTTFRQMLRIFMAILANKSAGGGTVTLTCRDIADTKNRITATVDADGNRTAITVDGV